MTCAFHLGVFQCPVEVVMESSELRLAMAQLFRALVSDLEPGGIYLKNRLAGPSGEI